MSDVNRDPIRWERSMTQDKDGQYVSYHDYAVLLDSHDHLRAELAEKTAALQRESLGASNLAVLLKATEKERDEARRLLDEARKQEPVAWLAWCQRRCPIGVTTTDASMADHYRANGYEVIDLYRAAPVPAQPAVPDDVAKDAAISLANLDRSHFRVWDRDGGGGFVAGSISVTDLVAVIKFARAILSATEGRSNG